jgi:hypothetical protein
MEYKVLMRIKQATRVTQRYLNSAIAISDPYLQPLNCEMNNETRRIIEKFYFNFNEILSTYHSFFYELDER